jgi:hypothetical protein
MTYRQGIVPSLILAPIRSGLRGFCLFILEIFSMEYQQKNPLRYYTLPSSYKFFHNICIIELHCLVNAFLIMVDCNSTQPILILLGAVLVAEEFEAVKGLELVLVLTVVILFPLTQDIF